MKMRLMQGNIIVKYRGISYNKRPPPPAEKQKRTYPLRKTNK